MTIQEQILAIKAKRDRESDEGSLEDLVRQWRRDKDVKVEVDENGNIWIGHPQEGHWLSDAELAEVEEYVSWSEKYDDLHASP